MWLLLRVVLGTECGKVLDFSLVVGGGRGCVFVTLTKAHQEPAYSVSSDRNADCVLLLLATFCNSSRVGRKEISDLCVALSAWS